MDLIAALIAALDLVVDSLAALSDASKWRASPVRSIVRLLLILLLVSLLVVPLALFLM
jgi:hypothetical protein